MKGIVLIGLLSLACLSCTDSDSRPRSEACGDLNLNTRIIRGKECSTENSPVVQLTILPGEGGIATCSGTLVSRDAVLTAGHCFLFDNDTFDVSVRVGGRDVGVSSVVIHPDINDESLPIQNDVAVVNLIERVSEPAVAIAVSEGFEPGDLISIFGYGIDEDQDPGVLRSGEMEVTGINSQTFFARFQDRGSGVCSGDSGGPAIVEIDGEPAIRGVISLVTRACEEDGASVFANLDSISIQEFLFQEVPGIRTR